MKNWKRWTALALVMTLTLGLLGGCGEQSESGEEGLTLSVCLGAAPSTLDPLRVTEARDMTVLGHLYENLMKTAVDNTGETVVVSGIAKSFESETNSDGTVDYTFRLRKADWSDGRRVRARDFVYAWRRLADPVNGSPAAAMLSVVQGFDEVQETGDTSLLAVEAKNDDTLLVTLNSACGWFLTDVCTSPATVPLREDAVQALKLAAMESNERAGGDGSATWCSDPTKLVVNGPYEVESAGSDSMTLRRNPEYRSAITTGPERIAIHYAAAPEDGWALYETGTVDFTAPLPEEQMALRAQEEGWEAAAELDTCCLLFNTGTELFNDPSVRRAFSMTLDRTALCAAAGEGSRPASGLVPSGVPDEDYEDFRSHGGDLVGCDPETYPEDCKTATELLDSAGFGAGYRFPTLELLCPNDGAHQAVAASMASMWSRTLGITVTPKAVTNAELEAALRDREYNLAMWDVRSIINDAEGFLARWTSHDPRNVVGYANSAFDTLLSVIVSANDETARRGCLHDAEALLIEDCPLAPLYFAGSAWQLRESYTGLCRDARGFFSFSTVAKLQS